MNEKQYKMLAGAAMEWMEREFLAHDVPQFIIDGLKGDMTDMRVMSSITWLEINGFVVENRDHCHILYKDGKEISRFVWTVSD